MPFGLKNAGATYQRLVNSMFKEHIGKIVEVYVNDMLVKSITAEDHVHNLSIIFSILTKFGMRLNLEKCIFGVEAGKFLGFVISNRGIEANPKKFRLSSIWIHPKLNSRYRALRAELWHSHDSYLV